MRYLISTFVLFLALFLALPQFDAQRIFKDRNGKEVSVTINPKIETVRWVDANNNAVSPMQAKSFSMQVDYKGAPNNACLYTHIGQATCKSFAAWQAVQREVDTVRSGQIEKFKNFRFTRGHAYQGLNNQDSGTATMNVQLHRPLAKGCAVILVIAGDFENANTPQQRMIQPYSQTVPLFFNVAGDGTITQITEKEAVGVPRSKKTAAIAWSSLEADSEAELDSATVPPDQTEAELDSAAAPTVSPDTEAELDSASATVPPDTEAELDSAGLTVPPDTEAELDSAESEFDGESEADLDDAAAGEEVDSEADLDSALPLNTHSRRARRVRVSVTVN